MQYPIVAFLNFIIFVGNVDFKIGDLGHVTHVDREKMKPGFYGVESGDQPIGTMGKVPPLTRKYNSL